VITAVGEGGDPGKKTHAVQWRTLKAQQGKVLVRSQDLPAVLAAKTERRALAPVSHIARSLRGLRR
jgi:hypothetical protein